jgi:hypothetical protein
MKKDMQADLGHAVTLGITVQETFVSNNILETYVPPLKRRRLLFNEDLTANAAAYYEPSLGPFKVWCGGP